MRYPFKLLSSILFTFRSCLLLGGTGSYSQNIDFPAFPTHGKSEARDRDKHWDEYWGVMGREQALTPGNTTAPLPGAFPCRHWVSSVVNNPAVQTSCGLSLALGVLLHQAITKYLLTHDQCKLEKGKNNDILSCVRFQGCKQHKMLSQRCSGKAAVYSVHIWLTWEL